MSLPRWILLLLNALAMLLPAQEEGGSVEPAGVPVPEETIEAYFGARPPSYLVDPQGLLDGRERRAREDFLRYHAEDSKIDFHLLLFDAGQQIPSDVRVEELGERFEAAAKPAFICLYFLGEPRRTDLVLSPALQERMDASEAERVLAQAVEAAAQKPGRELQLETFCIQMAIRTFELEQAAGLVARPEGSGKRQEPESPGKGAEEGEFDGKLRGWLAWVDEFSLPVTLVAAALILGGCGYWILRWQRVHRFPDVRSEPRLGGPHGAGIGPVISFGSSVVSPMKQRGQTKDPLGGL